jgi:hypothetical protein
MHPSSGKPRHFARILSWIKFKPGGRAIKERARRQLPTTFFTPLTVLPQPIDGVV